MTRAHNLPAPPSPVAAPPRTHQPGNLAPQPDAGGGAVRHMRHFLLAVALLALSGCAGMSMIK